jgi:hypothetical protein
MANLQNKSDYQRINLMAGENANEYMNLRNALNNYLGEDLNKYEPREALGIVCGDDDWNSKTASEIVCDYIGVSRTKYTLKEALNFIENFFSNTHYTSYDGVGDYAILNEAISVGNGSDGSFTLWFYMNETTGYILNGDSAYTSKFRFYAAQKMRLDPKNGASLYTDNGILPAVPGNWYHFAFVKAGDYMEIYLNAVLHDQIEDIDAYFVLQNIARRQNNTSFFSGKVDEFHVFNKALSLAEITTLFGDGTPQGCGDAKGISGLINSYPMEGNGYDEAVSDNPFGDELYDADASTFEVGTYHWGTYGNNVLENENKTLKATYVDSPSMMYEHFKDQNDLISDLTVGKMYKCEIDIKVTNGASCSLRIHNGSSYACNETITSDVFTRKTMHFVATDSDNCFIIVWDFDGDGSVWIDNISLKEVNGNPLTTYADAHYEAH